MKPDLYLITKDFPFGHGEDSFIEPEYPCLCKNFHVLIIATEVKEKTEYGKEGGINACVVPVAQRLSDKIISFLRFLCEKDCYAEMAAIIKDGKQVGRRIFRALMFGTAAETFYRRLKKKTGLRRDTKALFYFYWFDYRCFGLTMHRKKYPDIQIIARTHGCDLYDERELYGKQFFQPQMDRQLDRLIFAAQFARDYYLKRYQKQDSAKYPLHRLGVSQKKVTDKERRKKIIGETELLLVSCSHAIDIKRIDLIIEGLSSVENRNIKWVHIGGGERLGELKDKAQKILGDKEGICYQFTDTWTNDKVLRFYEENPVGCFITTTQTEGGSPVSVQEALSFGVPIIATRIGELPQMVRENGILLAENPDKRDVGHAIAQMADILGTEEYFSMCRSSLEIFEEKFNADNNFVRLAAELVHVVSEK